MVCEYNLDREIPRFFKEAMKGIEDRRKDRKSKLQDIPRFLEGAKQGLRVLGPAVAELDRHLARRFSTFRYIHLDENCMSNVLADLLRPDSAHGQGDLFLAAFVNHLRNNNATKSGVEKILPNEPTWSRVRVLREALTLHIEDWNRRIDIEISMRRGDRKWVGIAIENKPGAKDQPSQLADYAENLKKKYEGRYLLLYLTTEGTDPSAESLSPERKIELGDNFACASIVKWAQGWMQEAEEQVKSGYVKRFVADFRQVLLKSYADSETEP